MRESFIFYNSFYESIKELPNEAQLKVFKALSEYALYGNEIELTGISKAIFLLIKPQIDANNRRYENGKKGGRPPKEITEQKPKQNLTKTKPKPNVNDNVNVNVNDNDNDIYTALDESSSDTAKASKHKYGKYKHVLLKDEELQALKEQYENYQELIEYLDEYIEMKGYKAKSHYLCIKKWVVDAVKEKQAKQTKSRDYEQRNYTEKDWSKMYAN